MNLEVNGCEDMVWIQLAQDKIISYRSDHDNENQVFINGGEFLYQLNFYWIPNKPTSYLQPLVHN